MLLRNNSLLKLFAILLFVFELLAPSILNVNSKEIIVENGKQICITHTDLGFLSYLLIEEKSEEEREGKDLLLCVINFQESFLLFQPLCAASVEIAPIHHKIKFDTHPPLYKLFGMFRL